MIDINRFLDEKQKVKSWPAKKELKVEVLRYVAAEFEPGRFYTEKEVNRIIDERHTFNDYFLIRRELVNNWFLSRTKSGSRYWREESKENKAICDLITLNYDIGSIKSVLHLSYGTDAGNYYILTDKGEFILSDTEKVGLNNIDNEIYSTKSGESVLKTESKAYFLCKYM